MNALLLRLLVAAAAVCWLCVAQVELPPRPFVDGDKIFVGGKIRDFEGPVRNVSSPVLDETTGKPVVIGRIADMQSADLPEVIANAQAAWDRGQGQWPQMTVAARIAALENVVRALKSRRAEIVDVLMWEICKTYQDAASEFDRTMVFIASVISAFQAMDRAEGSWVTVDGILARVRRAAIGIMLCVGPFNYPFNETYATLIPALLMGNVVIMKIPSVGGLAHLLTMEAYAAHLPPGALQFVTGSGRKLLPQIMQSGAVDVLSFIGGSAAADQLIRAHPHVHRLKVFLQLEGKNIGVVTPDAFDDEQLLVQQIVLGALTYNGQRCTALKLIFVPQDLLVRLAATLASVLDALPCGMPWAPFDGPLMITPLPGNRVRYMQALLDDATSKGAAVLNRRGGQVHGNLMTPALLQVDATMRLFAEEQFGPLVPLVPYAHLDEVAAYLRATEFGQQASLFGHNATALGPLVDLLSTAVGRVNVNTQCARSPDVLPFSGRRSSAQGTMSVTEALRTFSVEVVVAGKAALGDNARLLPELDARSVFLQPWPRAEEVAPDL